MCQLLLDGLNILLLSLNLAVVSGLIDRLAVRESLLAASLEADLLTLALALGRPLAVLLRLKHTLLLLVGR